jgi:hypothetical protein
MGIHRIGKIQSGVFHSGGQEVYCGGTDAPGSYGGMSARAVEEQKALFVSSFWGSSSVRLAISNVSKAETLHHSATPGKVLGWIDTIASSLWLIFLIIIAISAIVSGAGPDT